MNGLFLLSLPMKPRGRPSALAGFLRQAAHNQAVERDRPSMLTPHDHVRRRVLNKTHQRLRNSLRQSGQPVQTSPAQPGGEIHTLADMIAERLRLGRALIRYLHAVDALAACDVLEAEPVALNEEAYRVLRELTAELSERAELDETALDDAIALEAHCALIEDTRAYGLDAVRDYIHRALKR